MEAAASSGDLGKRGRASRPVVDAEWAPLEMISITARDEFSTKSLEELRSQGSFWTFNADLRRSPRHEAQLEKDVLDAVGEVVLDQPRWWEAFEADEATTLKAITARTTRAICGDAAYHVLQWMTPTALRARRNGIELRLSRLVDYFPVEVASAAMFQEGIERAQFPLKTLKASDRYLVLAWTALRAVFMSDASAWPDGWGVGSCPCRELQPLADAIAIHMMDLLDRFRALPTEAKRNGPDRVSRAVIRANLLGNDAPRSSFLASGLATHVPVILSDMNAIIDFAKQYLFSIIATHKPAETGISPAPIRGAYVRDDVDFGVIDMIPISLENTTAAVRFECTVSDSSHVAETTLLDESALTSRLYFQALLQDLVPMFEKVLGEAAQSCTSTLVDRLPGEGPRSWITMPDRAVLVQTPSCVVPSTSVSLSGKHLHLIGTVLFSDTSDQWASLGGSATNAVAVAVIPLSLDGAASPIVQVRYRDVETRHDSFDHLPRQPHSVSVTSSSDKKRGVVLPAYAEFRLCSARALGSSKHER